MSNIFNFHGNVNMNVYCKKCTITEEPDSGCGLEINSITVDFEIGFIFELTNTSGTHVGAVITTNDVPVDMGCQETTSQYIISLDNANTLFSGLTIVFTSYSDDCQTSTCEVIIPISFSQLEIPVSGENTIFELNGEPVCTEDSSYSVVLAGPNSIVMNNTNGNLTIPAQEIDSNGPGGVYIYYYLCGGEVVYFVIVFMANPQGPRQMYSCNGNMCIEDSEGQYDHSSCYGNCNGGPTMYSCDNGNCVEDVEGEYNNNNCNNECVPPTMYSCIDDNCVEDEEGIYDEPTCFEGECYVAPVGLRMLFDDIANAPVVDPTNVGQWNTFYDLPTNGAVFTSVVVAGNQVTLVGGGAMTISAARFDFNANLIEFEDQTGIVVAVGNTGFRSCSAATTFIMPALLTAGNQAFANCSLVTVLTLPLLQTAGTQCFGFCSANTTFSFPALTSVGDTAFAGCTLAATFDLPILTIVTDWCFSSCTSIVLINVPLCITLGATVGNDFVFNGSTGNTLTINCAAVLAAADAGAPDGDLVYLIANNTATVNYI